MKKNGKFFAHSKIKRKPTYWLSLILLAAVGLLYMYLTWTASVKDTEQQALRLALTAEASFSREAVARLAAQPSDLYTHEYMQIKHSLKGFVKVNKDVRFSYIFLQKDGKIYFAADSESEDSPDYSPPGQEYTEAAGMSSEIFSGQAPVTMGRHTDRWGTWVSILVPMHDYTTGRTLALFGIDYPVKKWYHSAAVNTMEAGVISLCLLLLYILVYGLISKNKTLRDEKDKLALALNEIRKTRNRLKRAQSLARVGNWELEIGAERMWASDEVFKIFGYRQTDTYIDWGKIRQSVLPQDRDIRAQAFEALVEQNKEYNIEFRLIREEDGDVRTIRSSAMVERSEEGVPLKVIGVIQDITQLKQVEEDLKISEQQFRTVFEQAPIGIALCNPAGGEMVRVNQKFSEITGRGAEELAALDWRLITHPDDLGEDQRNTERLNRGEIKSFRSEKRYIRPDGSVIWVDMTVTLIQSDSALKAFHLCMVKDITERREAEAALRESERDKAILLSNLPGMAYRCNNDRDYSMHFVSQGCYELTGYKPEEILVCGKTTYNEIIMPEYRQEVWEQWQKCLALRTVCRLEYEIITASGDIKWVWEQGQGLFNENGQVVALEGLIMDITERKKREEEIIYLSCHDTLTGLYNHAFLEREKKSIDDEDMLPLSVITGDINGLKLINDVFGYDEGDRILKTTGEILQECCPENSRITRSGEDTFTILLPKISGEQAHAICKAVLSRLEDFSIRGMQGKINLSMSMGHATKTRSNQPINDVIKIAEDYMYKRKLLQSKSLHSNLINSMKTTLHEKSQETEAHAERLMELSKQLGFEMQLGEDQLSELELLAALHDIGKIGISDQILNKAGPLTPEEWAEMKKHPEVGYRIAMASPSLMPIAEYILHHHERWDGGGYPQGLQMEETPLIARMIAVVDAYDAMTQNRPYRSAMTEEDAAAEICKCAGSQFDPYISRIFVEKVLGRPWKQPS